MPRPRRWKMPALIGLVAVASVVWMAVRPAALPIPPPTATVERANLRQTVSATGRVVAARDVEIKCKASGAVVKLPVDCGDRVAERDLLLEIDPSDMQRVVRKAEVEVAASQARLEQARTHLAIAERSLSVDRAKSAAALAAAEAEAADATAKQDRERRLTAAALVSEEARQTADTAAARAAAALAQARAEVDALGVSELTIELRRHDVALAEASLENDQVALADARQLLADTRVLAPVAGVVTKRAVEIGQIISSGILNVGGGTSVMTVSDLSQMYVLAAVDESDVALIQAGQAVEVRADGWRDRTFAGTVVRVAPRGSESQNVVTFEVRIEVTGDDRALLRPEMSATVDIAVATVDDALTVPIAAVYRRAGKSWAKVGDSEREVTLGAHDGDRQQILSGLAEGDRVRLVQDEGKKKDGDGAQR